MTMCCLVYPRLRLLPCLALAATLIVESVFVEARGAEPSRKSSARASIERFARSATPKTAPGVDRLQLPDVPQNVRQDIEYLLAEGDRAFIPDVAAIFLRFARQTEQKHGSGSLLRKDNALVETLLSALKPEIPGDEITSSALAKWICDHRDVVGASPVLDEEVKAYLESKKQIDAKYRRMTESGKTRDQPTNASPNKITEAQ